MKIKILVITYEYDMITELITMHTCFNNMWFVNSSIVIFNNQSNSLSLIQTLICYTTYANKRDTEIWISIVHEDLTIETCTDVLHALSVIAHFALSAFLKFESQRKTLSQPTYLMTSQIQHSQMVSILELSLRFFCSTRLKIMQNDSTS